MYSILTTSLLALGLFQFSSGYYQPKQGTPWQIVLEADLGPLDLPVDVYDVDLYTTDPKVIKSIQDSGKKVICYFSAGTYEPNRADSDELHSNPAEIGANLTKEGFPLEQWLDIRSPRIVDIMKRRIDDAFNRGCDGLDPDNVDGYDNDNGGGFKKPLVEADSVTFLRTLADYAHAKGGPKSGMSIGLKNAGAIIEDTVTFLDWVVNEQCAQFKECVDFRPYIENQKPVFHIEYSNQDLGGVNDMCYAEGTKDFSTVIKTDESRLDKVTTYCTPPSRIVR